MPWCISSSHIRDTVAATLISKKPVFSQKKWRDAVVLMPDLQFAIRHKTHAYHLRPGPAKLASRLLKAE